MATENYHDSKFAVSSIRETDLSGSLASTVGATELFRYKWNGPRSITDIYARIKTGGTDAVRKIIVGTATNGGAMTAIGTATLGTQADKTSKALSISGTIQDGDELVFQHLGTGAEAWNVSFGVVTKEKYVQS